MDTREGGFLLDVEQNISGTRVVEEQRRYAAEMEKCSRQCASHGAEFFDDKPEYLGTLDGHRLVSAVKILPPRAVFVMNMRDPLDRMVSSMSMESCRHGVPLFGCYIGFMKARMDDLDPDNEFVLKGRYATHLQRWLQYVPRERMLLFFFEELVSDTLGVLNQILRGAGLLTLDAVPAIEESARIPFDTRRCLSRSCGKPASDQLRAAAAERCKGIRAFYEPEIRALGPIVGRAVPASWSTCEN